MIRRQVVVPARPAEVWEFLVAPETSGPWLGGLLEWSAREGDSLWFHGDDGVVKRGVVEVVRPSRYLRYRWWPEDDDGSGPASEVAYLLEPEEDQTRLTVEEHIVDVEEPAAPSASALSGRSAHSAPASASWTVGDDRGFRAWAQSQSVSLSQSRCLAAVG